MNASQKKRSSFELGPLLILIYATSVFVFNVAFYLHRDDLAAKLILPIGLMTILWMFLKTKKDTNEEPARVYFTFYVPSPAVIFVALIMLVLTLAGRANIVVALHLFLW